MPFHTKCIHCYHLLLLYNAYEGVPKFGSASESLDSGDNMGHVSDFFREYKGAETMPIECMVHYCSLNSHTAMCIIPVTVLLLLKM